MVPIGLVARGRIRMAIAPRKKHRPRDHGDDDEQHQHRGFNQSGPLLYGDVTGWGKHYGVAATQNSGKRQKGNDAKTAQDQSCRWRLRFFGTRCSRAAAGGTLDNLPPPPKDPSMTHVKDTE